MIGSTYLVPEEERRERKDWDKMRGKDNMSEGDKNTRWDKKLEKIE